jgi:hypothetical protein
MNHPIAARLRELLQAHPFQPFAIRLVDGSTYSVPHEDFLSVTKSGNVIYDDGEKTYKTINVMLIAVIDEKVTA